MSATPSGIVERTLAEWMGLDSSSVGEGLIARGVHARMMALDLRSEAEYERALREQADEVQALVEEVVVPESWFFRDDRPFEVLAAYARAGWLMDPDRPPLTVLSIPCAGGEEPYSIAMTLLDAGLAADRFRVDAVDISARAISRAIAGVYGSNSFRGAGCSLRPTYFREQNGSFTLDLAVRSTVRFHQGNLLDPALFADRPPFDAVFCRNVLIYLEDKAKLRVFATLDRLVADGGLLFLGHADRMDQPEGSPFELTDDKGGFAYRKGKVRSKPAKSASSPSRRKSASLSPRERAGVRDAALPPAVGIGFIEHRQIGDPPHPGPLPGGEGGKRKDGPPNSPSAEGGRRKDAPHPSPLPVGEGGRGSIVTKSAPAEAPALILDRAMGLADLGRYDEATALVEGVIRDGGASARAFSLLGLIAQAAGLRERAEAHYLKAIYLDGQHDEALLALALLARRRGDLVAEATYRKRAERVLARKAVP